MADSRVPASWFKYEFPLPEVPNAPVPSQADYSSKNCAWLIEFLASIINKTPQELVLRYENNTPNNKEDDIFVSHPNDGKNYWAIENDLRRNISPEQAHYESHAKLSSRLRLFEDNSPANITYFQPLGG